MQTGETLRSSPPPRVATRARRAGLPSVPRPGLPSPAGPGRWTGTRSSGASATAASARSTIATSDAGKEVALKLIRRNLDVELRGIRQCLNLKHPNLLVALRHPPGRPGRHLGRHGVRLRRHASRTSSPPIPTACRSTEALRLVPRHRRRRGLPARPRHRPPRPEAGQHLLRRGRGQDRRLRPVEVHLVQPPQRADRERRHRPLHGPRSGQRPLRQGDRHLRPGHHPLRDAHRPRAVRGRERRRGADEAPDGRARRLAAGRAVSQRGRPGAGEGPGQAVPSCRRNAGRLAGVRRANARAERLAAGHLRSGGRAALPPASRGPRRRCPCRWRIASGRRGTGRRGADPQGGPRDAARSFGRRGTKRI